MNKKKFSNFNGAVKVALCFGKITACSNACSCTRKQHTSTKKIARTGLRCTFFVRTKNSHTPARKCKKVKCNFLDAVLASGSSRTEAGWLPSFNSEFQWLLMFRAVIELNSLRRLVRSLKLSRKSWPIQYAVIPQSVVKDAASSCRRLRGLVLRSMRLRQVDDVTGWATGAADPSFTARNYHSMSSGARDD